jgi:hypothetical protein
VVFRSFNGLAVPVAPRGDCDNFPRAACVCLQKLDSVPIRQISHLLAPGPEVINHVVEWCDFRHFVSSSNNLKLVNIQTFVESENPGGNDENKTQKPGPSKCVCVCVCMIEDSETVCVCVSVKRIHQDSSSRLACLRNNLFRFTFPQSLSELTRL